MNTEAREKAGQLRRFLLGGVKTPDADPHLDALLRMYASVLVVLARQRRGLPDLRDAETCPTTLLADLGKLLGWDEQTRLRAFMQESDWRTFIPEAMGIWQRIGVLEGAELLGVALTGSPCAVGDWHAYKSVFGLGADPYYGITTPPLSGSVDTTHVRLADPLEDSELRSRVHAALRDIRQVRQQWRVSWHRIVETWALGSYQWRDLGGVWAVDTDTRELAFDTTLGAASVDSQTVRSFADGRVYGVVQLDDGETLRIRYCDDGQAIATWLAVEVSAQPANTANIRVINELGTSLLGPVSIPWSYSYRNHVQLVARTVGANHDASVVVNGTTVLTGSYAHGSRRGGYALRGSGAGGVCTVHYFEASKVPFTSVVIGA